jgi:hypothetical protein
VQVLLHLLADGGATRPGRSELGTRRLEPEIQLWRSDVDPRGPVSSGDLYVLRKDGIGLEQEGRT